MDNESIKKIRLIIQAESAGIKEPLGSVVTLLTSLDAEVKRISGSLASMSGSGAVAMQQLSSSTRSAIIPVKELAAAEQKLQQVQRSGMSNFLAQQREWAREIRARTGPGGEYYNIPRGTTASEAAKAEGQLVVSIHKQTGEQLMMQYKSAATNEAAIKKQTGEQLMMQHRAEAAEQVAIHKQTGERIALQYKADVEAARIAAAEKMAIHRQRGEQLAMQYKAAANYEREQIRLRTGMGGEYYGRPTAVEEWRAGGGGGRMVGTRFMPTPPEPAPGIIGTIGKDIVKVAEWTAATTAIFGTIAAVRQAIHTYTEFETVQNKLMRIGRGFGPDMESGVRTVTDGLMKLKVEFGSVGDEAGKAAIVFARLGLSETQVLQAVRNSLMAANVAGIGAEESARLLAAAMTQFGKSASDLPDILNKLNVMENTTRVETTDLLNSISRSGSVFKSAGGSIEELAAITAVVAQSTSRSGAEIGNAFKTIATRMGDVSVQAKVFQTTGVALRNIEGDVKPIGQALGELVVAFQQLSESERNSISTTLAGTRQRNMLEAALNDYFQIQAQVIRQYYDHNSASKEQDMIMGSLAKKYEQLVASFERAAVAFGSSGIGIALKQVISALTSVINAIASMGAAGGAILGLMTLYAASVVAAAVANGTFAKSLFSLSGGFAAVNGFFTQSISLSPALVAANNAIAISYDRMAASQARATAVAAGQSLAARGGAGAMAATSTAALEAQSVTVGTIIGDTFKQVVAVATGAAIGYAFLGVVDWITGIGKKIDITNPESKEGEAVAAGDQRIKNAVNEFEGNAKTVEMLKQQEKLLSRIEAMENAGITLTKSELAIREKINASIASLPNIQAQYRNMAREGQLSAEDLGDIQESLRSKQTEQIATTLSAYDEEIAKLETIKKAKLEEIQKGGGIALGGGPQGRWEKDKEFRATEFRQLREIEQKLRDMKTARDEFNVKALFPESFNDNLRNLREIDAVLLEIQAKAQEEVLFEEMFAIDPVEKAQAKIKEINIILKELKENKDLKLLKEAASDEDINNIEDTIKAVEKRRIDAVPGEMNARGQEIMKNAREELGWQEKLWESQTRLDSVRKNRRKADRDIDAAQELAAIHKNQKAQLEAKQQELSAKMGAKEYAPSKEEKMSDMAAAANLRIALASTEKEIENDKYRLMIAQNDTARKQTEEQQRKLASLEKELGLLSDEDMLKTRILLGEIKRGEISKDMPWEEAIKMPVDVRQGLYGVGGRITGIPPELTETTSAVGGRQAVGLTAADKAMKEAMQVHTKGTETTYGLGYEEWMKEHGQKRSTKSHLEFQRYQSEMERLHASGPTATVTPATHTVGLGGQPPRPPVSAMSLPGTEGKSTDELAIAIAREMRVQLATLFPLPVREEASNSRVSNDKVTDTAGTARGRARS